MPKAKKAVKKTVKKPKPKAASKTPCCKECSEKCCEGKLIGKISHYFSNIEVAVVDLASPLKVGDKIRIVGGEATDFEQPIESMQIEHEQVSSAKKGNSVGMKVKEKVHEGYKVYKI